MGLQETLRQPMHFLEDASQIPTGTTPVDSFLLEAPSKDARALFPLHRKQVLEHDEAQGILAIHVSVCTFLVLCAKTSLTFQSPGSSVWTERSTFNRVVAGSKPVRDTRNSSMV